MRVGSGAYDSDGEAAEAAQDRRDVGPGDGRPGRPRAAAPAVVVGGERACEVAVGAVDEPAQVASLRVDRCRGVERALAAPGVPRSRPGAGHELREPLRSGVRDRARVEPALDLELRGEQRHRQVVRPARRQQVGTERDGHPVGQRLTERRRRRDRVEATGRGPAAASERLVVHDGTLVRRLDREPGSDHQPDVVRGRSDEDEIARPCLRERDRRRVRACRPAAVGRPTENPAASSA